MNRLAKERSPYLRHAADQPIDWHPWGNDAFERARREDKPVFLSSGGVWCHWCHVMAKESFRDDEVASLLNELFVCIKLDRDERPDIDRRYQQANALMGNAGGWPLTIFLTPDRQPFFGGTYFPPDDRYGRPGFRKVLRSVNEFYKSRKSDADEYGTRVMDALRADANSPGEITGELREALRDAMLGHHDQTHGGFGTSPKFPMPGALAFLLQRAAAGDGDAASAVRRTLDGMLSGGFRDHLGGGFHRYSVDEAWLVPHFEKMADDNAWLLRSFLAGYAFFGDVRYRGVAEEIVRFTREVLSDPGGGFFASQDADVTPDDEGGYFTWTDADLRSALSDDEYAVIVRHLFHDRAALPHSPDKHVLFAARDTGDVAASLGMPRDQAERLIAGGKEKLLVLRRTRETPFIDRTLYTSLNGMFITSFLAAYRVLGAPSLRDFALQSLDRILQERWRAGALEHVEGVPAVLDDEVYLIEALVAAYEATGDLRRLDRARQFMDLTLDRFSDPAGGFFDTAEEVLGARLKRIEDVPHPSANGVAIHQLIKLWHITGEARYHDAAERSLRAFASVVAEMSIHAGTYAAALDAWTGMLKLTVETPADSELGREALRITGPATVMVHGEDRGRVIPCIDTTCYEPVTNADDLHRYVRQERKTL
jgi:uncharacterized protein YyaL (SSP411 family)